MNTAVKFTYDTSFDGAGKRAREQERVSEAEAIRAAAFAEGYAAGQADAAGGIEASTETGVRLLIDQMAMQAQSLDAVHRDTMRQASELARLIGVKLAGKLVERAPLEAIAGLVEACFRIAAREPRLVIRVCDSLLDSVKSRIEKHAAEQGFAGRIIFLAEPELAPGDVRVEWADGGAEQQFASSAADIEQLVATFAQSLSDPDGAA